MIRILDPEFSLYEISLYFFSHLTSRLGFWNEYSFFYQVFGGSFVNLARIGESIFFTLERIQYLCLFELHRIRRTN